jgi:hypothetical protein
VVGPLAARSHRGRVLTARGVIAALVAAAAVAATPAATAKEFDPGDLRLCDAHRCVSIMNRSVLSPLNAFYFGRNKPHVAARPRLGAPAFKLRYRNGYATGIAASARLDRFLSYGVNMGRFERGIWYRLPARVATELRKLSAGMKPLRVTKAALARSR